MFRHLFVVIYILFNSVQMPNGSQVPLSHEMKEQRSNPPTISLAPADEVGQRLIINGIVVDSITNEPIQNAHVYLYHADAKGQYQPVDPNDESTAKLSGEVVTRNSGHLSSIPFYPVNTICLATGTFICILSEQRWLWKMIKDSVRG
ncbi:MAG: hypothetical protein R2873_05970 [Caldilineaceae bacterium]